MQKGSADKPCNMRRFLQLLHNLKPHEAHANTSVRTRTYVAQFFTLSHRHDRA